MREFALSANNVTVSSNTLALVHAAAAVSCNLEILRAWAGQTGSTTSGQIRIQHVTQVTAFPTVTATTPVPLKQHDQISRIISSTTGSAGTSGTNATAEGAGAKTVQWEDSFNNLNGYLWVPTPRETVVNPAGSASNYGIYLPTAPASLVNWSAGFNFAEV